jgi:hypothetical protein
MIKGSELENRGPAASGGLHGGEEAAKDPQPVKKGGTKDAEAPNLAARVAAARHLRPDLREIHCGHCWGTGRDAALRVIEGES